MATEFKRQQILDGIYFTEVKNDKFTSNRISVNLVAPLSLDTASAYALLPLILKKGYRECPDFSSFNRALNMLYGAAVDGDVKTFGDCQIITLSIATINDKFTIDNEEVSLEAAKILSSLVLDPVIENGFFKESVYETEKQFLIDSIKAELNDKGSLALSKCKQIMCSGEPYSISCHGTLETAESLSLTDVFDHYNTLLQTAHIEIMFAGSGNADAVREVMFSSFSSCIEREKPFEIKTKIKKPSDQIKRVTERYRIVQSKLSMGFSVENPESEKEKHALRYAVALLGGTPFSKLFLNVREKLSLCYYCSASFDSIKNVMFVNSGVEEKNKNKAEEEILNQLSILKSGDISDDEFLNTRKLLNNVLTSTEDSISKLERYFLARIFSGEIITPEKELEIINSLTREDIISAANKIKLDTVYFMAPKEEE